MPASKSGRSRRRMTTSQIIFYVLCVIMILSMVIALVARV
jgi:hypothetical protein